MDSGAGIAPVDPDTLRANELHFVAMSEPLRERMTANLARFERRGLTLGDKRAAAVALTVVAGDAPCLLLTRRPGHAKRHAHQFALPGGRAEPGEVAETTARRELEEELGVALGADAVLGVLDDFSTRSGFVITPVVLWCDDRPELRPDSGEVAEVYWVPLSVLTPDIVAEQASDDPARPILSMSLVGTTIFAPTAAMIFQFAEVALHDRDTRVAHYEQPRFAWK